MSQIQKQSLGPAQSIPCKSCGELVSVSWVSILALAPFLISILLAGLLFPHGWYFSALLLIAGGVAMSVIHARWVPLVQRGA
jgi:hypothetical protein